MKILLYNWNDNSSLDALEAFKTLGYDVAEVKYNLADKLNDSSFERQIADAVRLYGFDVLFSFDYFPVLSKIAANCGIKYVSWVYDSPHYTLYSKTVLNECNYIFCFDRNDVKRLQSYGGVHVYHMPLAVNTRRLKRELSIDADAVRSAESLYGISFVGNLYNDQYNFFNQIRFPEYYKGFFDGLINAQTELYGCDIVSETLTDGMFDKIKGCFAIEENDELMITPKEYFMDFFRKKVTSTERIRLLSMLSQNYDVTLFAAQTDDTLDKVHFKGYVDYVKGMPEVFFKSKINLNITLRSIVSGIPLRCMDIMGAGGFLLSNWQPELGEFFVDGEEMVMYTGKDDLMAKAEYYLTHSNERREIAENGKRKIDAGYTMEKKLEEIMGYVQD